MQVIEKCDKKVIKKSNVTISLLCVQIPVSNCIHSIALSIITTCVTLYSNANTLLVLMIKHSNTFHVIYM